MKVWSMVQYVGKKTQIDLSCLKRLGIDEIALRKGQGDYIVVLVDLDRKVPIGLPLLVDKQISALRWGETVLHQIVGEH